MTTPAGVVAEVPPIDTSGIEAPTNPFPQPERSAQILAPAHQGHAPTRGGRVQSRNFVRGPGRAR
jgi:hypothetical protein